MFLTYLFVRPFVTKTVDTILKMNEAVLMPIGTHGPHEKGMKWSTLGVVGQGCMKLKMSWRRGRGTGLDPICLTSISGYSYGRVISVDLLYESCFSIKGKGGPYFEEA